MGTEAVATPMALVPVVMVVVEEVAGRLVMSTLTLREREEGPPPPFRELALLLARGKSSTGKVTALI